MRCAAPRSPRRWISRPARRAPGGAVAGDRRANGLTATVAGHRRLAALAERVLARDARIAARLTAAERQALRGLLDRLG